MEPQCVSYNPVGSVEMLISLLSIPPVVFSVCSSVFLVDLDKLDVVEGSHQSPKLGLGVPQNQNHIMI